MLRKEEILNVSKLEPFKRYKYFIKKIADFEELWTLKNDVGDLAISGADDKVLIAFWSAEDFTNSCQNGVWENYHPVKITMDELEEEILPMIREKGYLIDVFPVNNKSGFVVSIDEFVRDLNEELENYE